MPSALSRMEGDREREKGVQTQGAWPGMCLTHRQCLEYSYFSTVHIFNSTTKYAHFCRLCLCPIMPLKDEAIPAQPCPTVVIHVVLVPVSHTQYLPMTRRTFLSIVDCRLSRQDKWKLFRSEGLCFLAIFFVVASDQRRRTNPIHRGINMGRSTQLALLPSSSIHLCLCLSVSLIRPLFRPPKLSLPLSPLRFVAIWLECRNGLRLRGKGRGKKREGKRRQGGCVLLCR